jgi:hypothetical protein
MGLLVDILMIAVGVCILIFCYLLDKKMMEIDTRLKQLELFLIDKEV